MATREPKDGLLETASKDAVELTESDLDEVSGGARSAPTGPVPIPFPNTDTKPVTLKTSDKQKKAMMDFIKG